MEPISPRPANWRIHGRRLDQDVLMIFNKTLKPSQFPVMPSRLIPHSRRTYNEIWEGHLSGTCRTRANIFSEDIDMIGPDVGRPRQCCSPTPSKPLWGDISPAPRRSSQSHLHGRFPCGYSWTILTCVPQSEARTAFSGICNLSNCLADRIGDVAGRVRMASSDVLIIFVRSVMARLRRRTSCDVEAFPEGSHFLV